MAEVYPSDAYLTTTFTTSDQIGITLLTDGDVGVLPWQKLLWRLCKAAEPIADLRVCDAGDLDIDVKSGKFFNGNTLITFAESTGNTLADDKANIYLYLTAAGTLVINEYTAFPDPSTPQVRLATVTTSGGDITAIVDNRNQNLWGNPGMAAKQAAVNIVCHNGEVVTHNGEVVYL